MKRSLLWRFLQCPIRIFVTVFFGLKVYGRHNVPRTGGVLLVANHQSFLDPMLVAVQLYRPISFMARDTLWRNPVFGRLISALHAYPVRRGEGDVGAIRETLKRLHEGHVLNIYPEGTRTEDGRIRKIQPGVALLIRRADVPVIPVVIEGAFEAWPRNRKLFRPHPVRVMYGPPLKLDGLKGNQIVALLQQTLEQMQAMLRAQSPSPRAAELAGVAAPAAV